MKRATPYGALNTPLYKEPFIIVPLAFAIIMFSLGIWAANTAEKDCESKGGHTETSYSTGTGVDSRGNVVTTTNSADLCLSDDGRIIK